jgi:hypothetical protein
LLGVYVFFLTHASLKGKIWLEKEQMFGYNDRKKNGGYHINNLAHYVTDIAALEPCYGKEGGNATRVYTADGCVYEDKRRTVSVLKAIARYYGADLQALRKNYGTVLGLSQYVPLALTPKLVLVPLKMRKPAFEQDGAIGYVNVCAVVKAGAYNGDDKSACGDGGALCQISLSGGNQIGSHYSQRSTEKRLVSGRLALNHFLSLQRQAGSQRLPIALELPSDDALARVAAFSRIMYELLVDRPAEYGSYNNN